MPVDMNELISLDRLKEYKGYENGGIAPNEATSTASKAYKTGARFYFQGKLCIATSDIAQGGTIILSPTASYNCKLDVLGDDVTKQSEQIGELSEQSKNLNNVGAGEVNTSSSGVLQSNPSSFGLIDLIPCSASTEYTASYYDATVDGNPSAYVSYYDENKTFIEKTSFLSTTDGAVTFTSIATAHYLHIYFYKSGGFTLGNNADIQIELGSTKTDYVLPLQPRGTTETDSRLTNLEKHTHYATPEMYGAAADGTTDDTVAIQSALDSNASLILMTGSYKTTQPLVISRSLTLVQTGLIKYTGTSSAIKIKDVLKCNIHLDMIQAPNGNGIEFYATEQEGSTKRRVQYANLWFNTIGASGKCIWLNLDVATGIQDTDTVGWINEIRIYNGKFSSGDYGIYADAKGYQKINNIKIYNTGIEGVTTGIYMANGCTRWSFNNMRYAESFTTLMRTVGNVRDFAFYGAQTINYNKLTLSNQTSGIFRIPIYKNGVLVTGETAVNEGVISGIADTVDSLMIKNDVICLAANAITVGDGADHIPMAVTSNGGVVVGGKNLFPEATVSLLKSDNRTHQVNVPNISGTFTLSWALETNASAASTVRINIYYDTGDEGAFDVGASATGSYTVTTPEGRTLRNVYLYISSGTTIPDETYANFTNLQLEAGDSATTYEVYKAVQEREAGATTLLYTNKGVNTIACADDANITYTVDPKLYIQECLAAL